MTNSVCEYNNNINIYSLLILFTFVSSLGSIIFIYYYFNSQLQLTNKILNNKLNRNYELLTHDLNITNNKLQENKEDLLLYIDNNINSINKNYLLQLIKDLQLTNKELHQKIQNNLNIMLQNINNNKQLLDENLNENYHKLLNKIYEELIKQQNNHILIGFVKGVPIIMKKNISGIDKDMIDNIKQSVGSGAYPNIILPYLYSIPNIRNLDLFKSVSEYDYSFVDENHSRLLPSYYLCGQPQKQEYINRFREQINEVMEKYPGLFAPIN
jgi:hypothetical protein